MKHLRLTVVFLAGLCAAPLQAETCPPLADHRAELDALLDAARAAPTEMAAREVSGQLWQVWLRAPDQAAQTVLDRGMAKRRSFDYLGARADFDALVDYCPDYAEGYNQRAFVNFLSENYDAALVDLDRTLAILPDHVGAQSGRALTLMRMGRLPEAREQMLEALANNPWLSERALVAPGALLGPKGQDI